MLIQILINSFINGLLLSLVALGFHVIFTTTKIFHIAHAAIYVSGVYLFLWLNPGLGLAPAIFATLILSFLTGVALEWLVYKPLFIRSNNENIVLISSLGVYTIMTNLITLGFGTETKIVDNSIRAGFQFYEIMVTGSQLWQIVFAIPLTVLFVIFMSISGYGLKIRAIADNPVLASVMGINTQRIRYLVLGIGSVMAVSSGLLKVFDTGIEPYSGMTLTLSAVIAVVLGGTRSLYGTIIASFILCLIQGLTEFYLSAQWKDAVTFTLLIGILLLKTEGILQFKIRVDER